MNIYNDYLNTIKQAIQTDRLYENYSKKERKSLVKNSMSYQTFSASENGILPSLQDLMIQVPERKLNQRLGLHPDFAHLKGTENIEDSAIVSMFIDIKGSTNLFKKYSNPTIVIIQNTIQRAAIHTCLIFGGYVHRLQGDGAFVYFGGKEINLETASKNALKAATIFTYFVKNDLKELFLEQGIEKIFTRIGIDLGYDEDVTWAMAGTGEISEVTTFSLHTSLASKMQSYAESNGIVIGENMVTESKISDDFYSTVASRTMNNADRYIFQIPEESFRYTQYDFRWDKYLKTLDFVVTDPYTGRISIKSKTLNNPTYLKPIAETNKPYFNK